MNHHNDDRYPAILIVGASSGIGHAMAAEFWRRGWHVVGTVRGGQTELHDLARRSEGRVEVETVDICVSEQIDALHARLAGRVFDIVFVNAGIANADRAQTIADVSTDEFVKVIVTNALGPMRTIETLQDLVPADGLIGIMSSGQGSLTNNTMGGFEVYRGSKAALNQFMRSYAARHADDPRALLLLAPGWIRTAMGGAGATFSLEETIPDIVDTVLAKRGKPGLAYLDRLGQTVPW